MALFPGSSTMTPLSCVDEIVPRYISALYMAQFNFIAVPATQIWCLLCLSTVPDNRIHPGVDSINDMIQGLKLRMKSCT